MNRIYFLAVFSLYGLSGFAQPNVPRSTSSVTAVDQRLSVPLNFYMPRYTDTTVANIAANIGHDSISGMIYTRMDGKVWVRKSSPKRWVEVGAGAAIDTLLISTRAWRQKGVDSLKQLIPTNNNQLTNGAGYITSFAATLKAVTRTLDTINANTTIVLDQSNFDAFTLRNSASTNSISLNESATEGAYTSIQTSTFGLVNQINTRQRILLSTRKASNSNKGGIVNVSASNPFVEIGGDTLKLKNSLYAAQSIGATGSNLFPYEPVTADTTNYKPLALNSVNGVLIRLDKWPSSGGTGTVTSIATNTGSGIKGGPITTTGTLSIDTGRTATAIVTGGSLNKVRDSIQVNVDLKQNLLVNSAGLASALSDETGTGVAVFGTSPTFTTQILAPAIYFSTASGAATGKMTSTTNVTKGKYYLNDGGSMVVDESNTRLGIGNGSPSHAIDIAGSGASVVTRIRNAQTSNAETYLQVEGNSATSYARFMKLSTSYSTYKTLTSNTAVVYNSGTGDITVLNDVATGKISFAAGAASAAQWLIAANGNLSSTGSDGTAYLHLKAGTATASTSPQKFTAGTLLTSAESGAVETNTVNDLFYSNSTGRGQVSLWGYIAKTATYTATNGDYTIDCTANTFTVSIPTAIGIVGRHYEIVNSGAGIITVSPVVGGQLFNGAASITVLAGHGVTIMSDNANFKITSQY